MNVESVANSGEVAGIVIPYYTGFVPHKDPEAAKAYQKTYQKAYHADPENRARAAARRQARGRSEEVRKARERREALPAEERAALAEKRLEWGVRHRYGIPIEEQRRLRASAAGLCQICGEPDPLGRRLALDHCHETGKARGMLCGLCNRGLGWFQDSPERLSAAIAYLERSRA